MGTPHMPSLIGGIPDQTDFAPSILFATLFLLALFPLIHRFKNPDTRTWTLGINTFCYNIERIIIYSLRATQAHKHHYGDTLESGLLMYQQLSFGIGYLVFGQEAVFFAKTVLVNTTFEDPNRGSKDRPGLRGKFRGWSELYNLLWIIPTVMGSVGYSFYPDHIDQTGKALAYRILAYLSSAFGLLILVGFITYMWVAGRRYQYADERAIQVICGMAMVAAITPVYRLFMLHHTTPILATLPDSAPLYPSGSLTTPASKATFYLFQTLPEVFLVWYIQSINIRAVLNTGPFGDYQKSDKRGIPRLRENGVEVEGVGVPTVVVKKKKPRWWLAFTKLFRWRRREDEHIPKVCDYDPSETTLASKESIMEKV